MSETTKQVLINLETVRVLKVDDLNVTVERLEKSVNPTTKEVTEKWRNKGYYGTIRAALRSIVKNELLIKPEGVKGLLSYLNEVVESNDEVLKAIDELVVEVSE